MIKKTSAVIVVIGLYFATINGLLWAGIEGSKHDFSNKAWSKDDSCGACHSPEKDKPPAAAPLWDQTADLTRTFGTSIRESKLAGEGTRMCIRCHDGTVAKDFTPTPLRGRIINIQNPSIFSTGHGSSDHPVGIKYPMNNRGYNSASSVTARGTVVLPNGRVECISCHDPHDQAGLPYMLVTTNARSNLCLTCHRK